MMLVHPWAYDKIVLLAVAGGVALLAVCLVLACVILAGRNRRAGPSAAGAGAGPAVTSVPRCDAAERRRILTMVRDGRLNPEEADRLLFAIATPPAGGSAKCPYCAEILAADAAVCPHCRTLLAAPSAGASGSRAARPGGGAQFLALYMLFVGGVILLQRIGLPLFGRVHAPAMAVLVQTALAAVAVLGGVLLLRGQRAGWVLALLWSGAQIVELVVGHQVLNRQILHVGMVWTTNGSGLGINLIGVGLVCLCLAVAKAGAPGAASGART